MRNTSKFSVRVLTSTVAIVLVTLLAGCASGEASPGESGSAPSGSGSSASVDTMFGTVEIPAPEDGELTVVALGWSDAEMALALGVRPVATYDWQGFGAENKGVGPWATGLFGDVTPEIIARENEALNYEQIQSFEPDVILNTRSGNEKGEFDRLSEIAPTVYGPEGAGAYATEWREQLTLVGQALSKTERAQEAVAGVDAKITQTAAANPEFAGLTIASAAKFGDAYGAYLPGDGRFDILKELGFVNNPPVTELGEGGFFATVSAENVGALNADVAVILPIGFSLKEVKSDKLLSSLGVVEDDRAVYLDPDSNLGGAWGVSSVLSIPVVLDEITPELAEAADRLER